MKAILGDGLRSALGNGARLLALNWVEHALRVIYMILLARYLGAELYGQWAYGVAAYAILIGVSGSGFDTVMAIRLGADKSGAGRYMGVALGLRLACFVVAVLSLLAYALVVEPDPLNRAVLLTLTPAVVGRGVSHWVRATFLAHERTREYLGVAAAFRLAEVVLGVVWLLAGGGLLGVAAIHSLGWLAEGAAGLRAVNERLAPLRLSLVGAEARELLRHGTVLSLAAAAQACLQAGPLLLLRYQSGDMAALGQFALVLNAMTVLVASAAAFAGAAVPVLSRLVGRGDRRLARYGPLSLLATLAAALAASGVGWALGPPLAVGLLGPDFALAGRLVGPMMLVVGLALAPTGYGQLLVLAGKRWVTVLANTGGALALLAAMAPALASMGIEGAVLATGVGWGVRATVLIGWATATAPRRDVPAGVRAPGQSSAKRTRPHT